MTVCIPLRIALSVLVAVACNGPMWIRHTLAVFFGWVVIGFVGQMIRNAPTGGFGGSVWWSLNRYVHVLLYITSAILLYVRCGLAYVPLVADVAFAAVTGVVHYRRTET